MGNVPTEKVGGSKVAPRLKTTTSHVGAQASTTRTNLIPNQAPLTLPPPLVISERAVSDSANHSLKSLRQDDSVLTAAPVRRTIGRLLQSLIECSSQLRRNFGQMKNLFD